MRRCLEKGHAPSGLEQLSQARLAGWGPQGASNSRGPGEGGGLGQGILGLREVGAEGAAVPTEMPGGWGYQLGPRSEMGCRVGLGGPWRGSGEDWTGGRWGTAGEQDGGAGPGAVPSPGVLDGTEVVRWHFRAASTGWDRAGWFLNFYFKSLDSFNIQVVAKSGHV